MKDRLRERSLLHQHQRAVAAAVIAEHKRCVEVVEAYRQRALDDGMMMVAAAASQIAKQLQIEAPTT